MNTIEEQLKNLIAQMDSCEKVLQAHKIKYERTDLLRLDFETPAGSMALIIDDANPCTMQLTTGILRKDLNLSREELLEAINTANYKCVGPKAFIFNDERIILSEVMFIGKKDKCDRVLDEYVASLVEYFEILVDTLISSKLRNKPLGEV